MAIPDEEEVQVEQSALMRAIAYGTHLIPKDEEKEEVREPLTQVMFERELVEYSEELKVQANHAIEASLLYIQKEEGFEKDEEQAKERCQEFLDMLFVEVDKKEIERIQELELTESEKAQVHQESPFERFRGPEGLQTFMKEGKKVMQQELKWFYNKVLGRWDYKAFRDHTNHLVDSGQITEEKWVEMIFSQYKRHQAMNKATPEELKSFAVSL